MVETNYVVDCQGLACPMPVVKTKKAMQDVPAGELLKIIATDKGSVADLKSWSSRGGHEYVELIEENGVYYHFIRKTLA